MNVIWVSRRGNIVLLWLLVLFSGLLAGCLSKPIQHRPILREVHALKSEKIGSDKSAEAQSFNRANSLQHQEILHGINALQHEKMGSDKSAGAQSFNRANSLQHQETLHGFNALQYGKMGWNKPAAARSFRRMVELGSNAVVLITFLEQDSPTSTIVRRSDAVTESQLRAAIGYAHDHNLKIILKPQILIPGSWPGAIDFDQPWQWRVWFDSYSKQLLKYARFASANGVDALVIGTELSKAAGQVDWSGLIKQVRAQFRGQVTYAAHNVEGVKRFHHWQELDVVALTLYPSLGRSGEGHEMQRYVDAAVQNLRQVTQNINMPLWVLEIGMPSARGASAEPWAWQRLKDAKVDLALQKDVLYLWLRALDKPWIDGVFIWAWYSDNNAGGKHNTDYTPQNKPAENMIRRFWGGS